MGWSIAVAMGCTLVGVGAGKFVWMCTLGSGSHSTGSLGTLGFVWGFICCFLVCFSIIVCTLIYFRVWAGTCSGGWAGVSSGDAQLAEASLRAIMYWSCVSNWAVGSSVRASVSVVIPCIIWSYRVTTGVVMVWLWKSTLSEIFSALVSFDMTRWHR